MSLSWYLAIVTFITSQISYWIGYHIGRAKEREEGK